jgi:hypothetical protein
MKNLTNLDTNDHIKGSDLKFAENDIFRSLSRSQRILAWIFGGTFGLKDPADKLPRVVIVHLPSVWCRIYFKHLYKWFNASKQKDGETHAE